MRPRTCRAMTATRPVEMQSRATCTSPKITRGRPTLLSRDVYQITGSSKTTTDPPRSQRTSGSTCPSLCSSPLTAPRPARGRDFGLGSCPRRSRSACGAACPTSRSAAMTSRSWRRSTRRVVHRRSRSCRRASSDRYAPSTRSTWRRRPASSLPSSTTGRTRRCKRGTSTTSFRSPNSVGRSVTPLTGTRRG